MKTLKKKRIIAGMVVLMACGSLALMIAISTTGASGTATPAGPMYPGAAFEAPANAADEGPSTPQRSSPSVGDEGAHTVAHTVAPTTVPTATLAPDTALPASTDAPTPVATETAPEPEPAVAPSCPRYPILLSPAVELREATEAAAAMWSDYLGCTAFEIAPSAISIRYENSWPGACTDPDVAACTMNAILLSPIAPRYDARGVITHELGHVLNFTHSSGPAVMNPANWSGPATLWCSVDALCN